MEQKAFFRLTITIFPEEISAPMTKEKTVRWTPAVRKEAGKIPLILRRTAKPEYRSIFMPADRTCYPFFKLICFHMILLSIISEGTLQKQQLQDHDFQTAGLQAKQFHILNPS